MCVSSVLETQMVSEMNTSSVILSSPSGCGSQFISVASTDWHWVVFFNHSLLKFLKQGLCGLVLTKKSKLAGVSVSTVHLHSPGLGYSHTPARLAFYRCSREQTWVSRLGSERFMSYYSACSALRADFVSDLNESLCIWSKTCILSSVLNLIEVKILAI